MLDTKLPLFKSLNNEKTMKHILLMMAAVLSYDEIANKIEEALKAYRENPTSESSRIQLDIACFLMNSKMAMDQSGGFEELTKQMDRLQKGEKMVSQAEKVGDN